MSMLCAISGEAPTTPVASTKSGSVFEKRLIEAYIAEHGKDPVTGEELTVADLIELKASNTVRPRPPTLTSIPALLATFQNEWDAVALESHTLRQQLAQVRQELSTALYQHDAATRVIARLLKERDEAREALSNVTVGAGAGPAEQMEVDAPQVPEYIQEKVDATKAKFSAGRKRRPVPEGWATTDTVSAFKTTGASEGLFAGTKALALDASGDLALLGGADGAAGVYSVSQQEVLRSLKAQDGAINDVAWAGRSAVTASSEGVVRVWNESGSASAELKAHAGEVLALAAHPSETLLASVGSDKSWVLYDLEKEKAVVQIYDNNKFTPALEFHPDGHLLAAGTGAEVIVYDIRSGSIGANLGPLSAPVSSMSFSENGYWLALALQGQSTVEIWDLRKMAATKTLDIGSRVDHVSWDYSGQFLAAAGPSGVSVQQNTKVDNSRVWIEPFRSGVSAVATAWGPRAESLVAVGGDGVVSVLG